MATKHAHPLGHDLKVPFRPVLALPPADMCMCAHARAPVHQARVKHSQTPAHARTKHDTHAPNGCSAGQLGMECAKSVKHGAASGKHGRGTGILQQKHRQLAAEGVQQAASSKQTPARRQEVRSMRSKGQSQHALQGKGTHPRAELGPEPSPALGCPLLKPSPQQLSSATPSFQNLCAHKSEEHTRVRSTQE